MKKIGSEDLKNLRYRKERMTRKAKKIDAILSGREKSLHPLTRTPRGNYSEAQAQKLVKQLVRARRGQRKGPVSDNGIDEEFLTSFLYCAIRLTERGPALLWGPGFEWSVEGTFQDLYDFAVPVDPCGDCYDRWYSNFGSREGLSDSFRLMDYFYEEFSGESIQQALTRRLPDVVTTASARYNMEPDEDEPGISPEEWEMLSDEDEVKSDGWEEWVELEKEDAREAEEFLQTFPEKENFCEAYLQCRKRYFETEHCRGLAPAVELAIDEFLLQAGWSGYLKDDEFFLAYGLLDRATKDLRALLREE